MRSIPLAMTWEMLHRGRWNLIGGFLFAFVMPTALFSSLLQMGGVDFHDSGLRGVHIALMNINMFVIAATVLAAQGPPSRVYTLPVKTSTLVACHLFLAMAFVSVEVLASNLALNGLFKLGWPLWWPVIFVAALMSSFQATCWYTEKTAWMPLAFGVVTGSLGYWYYCRSSSNSAIELWNAVSPIDVGVTITVVIASYFLAVAGVSRSRCGEQIKPLGIVAWIERVLDVEPDLVSPFHSSVKAQFWFEWRKKGEILPAMVIFGLVGLLGIWSLFVRDPKELINGFVAGGPMLCVAGTIVALIIGNAGTDVGFEMGSFLASRPLSNVVIARSILKMTAKSVLNAWVIWLSAFAVIYGVVRLFGYAPPLPQGVDWWYLPATLLGCWTVVASVASIFLTGRTRTIMTVICAAMVIYVGAVCTISFTCSKETLAEFFRVLAAACGIGFVVATVLAFLAARNVQLIGVKTVAMGIGVWIAASSAIVFEIARQRADLFPGSLLLIGVAALGVFPLAAAPLAVSWNRNR